MDVLEAAREFEGLTIRHGRCLLPPLRYVISRDKRRKALCEVVDRLSKEAFPLCIPYIINTINMSKSVCGEYEDSKSQVDGILEWLSRMVEYRDILLEAVKHHREKYGLKI